MNITCPECQSADIRYFESGKRYSCNHCGFSSTEKEFKKHCIFLSYGHNTNKEQVRQVKTDMEHCGHNVWFDKNDIKAGVEFKAYLLGELDKFESNVQRLIDTIGGHIKVKPFGKNSTSWN